MPLAGYSETYCCVILDEIEDHSSDFSWDFAMLLRSVLDDDLFCADIVLGRCCHEKECENNCD